MTADSTRDVALFIESVRWLGVRWGMASCRAGLQRVGFRGRFVYWRWHDTLRALTVVPVMVDTAASERQACRLAEHITRLRRERLGRCIYVIGYSAGGYVALRSLELLDEDITVQAAALLAAAVDPGRDLNPAAARVERSLVVSSSRLDAIVGLGTLATGTLDRRFTPSQGAVGYRGPACDKLIEVRWRPELIRDGHWGGHFTAAAERFVARQIAPRMGIGRTNDRCGFTA
jgi:pimeloyl-ACP methyl ester carboxylesterase